MTVLILKSDGTIYDTLTGDHIAITHYEDAIGKTFKVEYICDNEKITHRIAESFTREEIEDVK